MASDPSNIILLSSCALLASGTLEGASLYKHLLPIPKEEEKKDNDNSSLAIMPIMAYGISSVPLSIVGASPSGVKALQTFGFPPTLTSTSDSYHGVVVGATTRFPSPYLQQQQNEQHYHDEQMNYSMRPVEQEYKNAN
eukprot:647901-Ditylum_brightwellii.AAC.1